MTYNPWPNGRVPRDLQRPELQQIDFKFNDAREVVGEVERRVANFAGCRFAIAVDCCSHGIFLALKYYAIKNSLRGDFPNEIIIPERTYVSVPLQILYANFGVKFEYREWSGAYQLKPTHIWDAAVRWYRGMYMPKTTMVLSFQIKKTIPIGRGGMILTDDPEENEYLRLMRYDGRDLNTPYDSDDHVKVVGYHYYMTPEDAARGILLMDKIKTEGDSMIFADYPRVDKK